MEPRYYNAAGHIDYDAVKPYAAQLRREAIDAFWSGLFQAAAVLFGKLRQGAIAQTSPSAIAPRT